ncbi:MAG TPA: carboxymuconolactone decarboxylase family protein [Acidothermaceae bacterium]|jgi:4-carboxymuconolactone decarboxylase
MTAPRLPKLSPAELDEQQRELYDAIASGPRARGPQLFALTDNDGGLEGPFNAMLLSPAVGSALQALGSAVRYGSGFDNRDREIAILVVAHAWDCAFEVYAHEAVGRAAGLSVDELAALKAGAYDQLTEHERLVANTSAALAVRSALTDDEFNDARDALGLPLLFELTTLVGYYATLALQLRVFDVGAPS